jgi:hypothetical protein
MCVEMPGDMIGGNNVKNFVEWTFVKNINNYEKNIILITFE